MIEIKIVEDEKTLEKICERNSFPRSGSTFAMAAVCNGNLIGSSVFSITKKGMTLERVEPESDIMLADGIIRSTLHVADNRDMTQVYYSDGVSAELLTKLGFIKDADKKLLDIDMLTKDCCGK